MLDWIKKEITKNIRTGIGWTLTTQLEDLPYIKYKNAPKMKIGIKKTKLMTIGESPNPTVKIDGLETETVDRFMNMGL